MRAGAHLALALCGALLASLATATSPCRIAYDIGSSGIRAGADDAGAVTRADIDYLAPLAAGRGLAEVAAPTAQALRTLPAASAQVAGCTRVAAGFSAWRLAFERDAPATIALLAGIRRDSGVAILVAPQDLEGRYAWVGARRLLGDRLVTSHVLDIGGGSLQIGGATTSFGLALGQRLWHARLCAAIRAFDASPCTLLPMSDDELASARAMLDRLLAPAREALPGPVTLTAVSPPVTRGVALATVAFAGTQAGTSLPRAAITRTIGAVARSRLAEVATATRNPPRYAAYLVSDLLLVEALLRATGGAELAVAEADLTNVPGLIADDRAYAWAANYDCYLDRLSRHGIAAYATDPASCPAPPGAQ